MYSKDTETDVKKFVWLVGPSAFRLFQLILSIEWNRTGQNRTGEVYSERQTLESQAVREETN